MQYNGTFALYWGCNKDHDINRVPCPPSSAPENCNHSQNNTLHCTMYIGAYQRKSHVDTCTNHYNTRNLTK